MKAYTIVAITDTLSRLITMVEYCFGRVGPRMRCSMAMLGVSDELVPPSGSMAILVGARLTNECVPSVTTFSSLCAPFITRSLPSDACAQKAMSSPPRTVISSKLGTTPPSRAIHPKSLPDADIPAKSTAACATAGALASAACCSLAICSVCASSLACIAASALATSFVRATCFGFPHPAHLLLIVVSY